MPQPLFKSEDYFRTLFEASGESFIVTNEQGQAIECNDAATKLYKCQRSDILGTTPLDWSPELQSNGRSSDEWAAEILSRVAAGETIRFEWENRCLDGTPVFVGVTVRRAIIDGQAYYLIISRDITALKQAETSYRLLFDELRNGFALNEIICNADGQPVDYRFLSVNPAFERMTELKAINVVGHTVLELFPHTETHWIDTFGRVALTGETAHFENFSAELGKYYEVTAYRPSPGQFACMFQDITDRKQAEEKVNMLAFYDLLTGLPNRALLADRMAMAMASSERSDTHGAMLFIDLDNFKTLNDTHGHEVGDLLLKQVADRLKSHIRAEDTAARQGGDEFVVLLSNLGSIDTEAAHITEGIANKVLAELNRTYHFGDLTHHCTASIGVTLFKGRSASLDKLMKQADLAMYRAKAAGRGVVRFFDPNLDAAGKSQADKL